ncbi:uncharacterized protein LOC116020351 [Ipomoea triloba]|uniref:uncharacterized protein LOC116020351 n=1 Tax=Ipomoea triloba TaxID=35885 RepID=UPI00125E0F49|nr:uncharacterized protein LOC116020351 [Ipomoea triloba]
MKNLSSSTVIGNKRKLPYSASQDGNVVNTTIRNTAEDYMMGQTFDNRNDKGTTCNTNYKQLTGSERSQSYSLGISRPNITQESDPQVVICRDLSQDFDEVMESEVQSVQYDDCGDPSYSCEHCSATFWKNNDKDSIHVEVVSDIKKVLDENNVLVQSFRNAKTHIQANPRVEIKMRLIDKRNKDARTYNLPTASEVAALILGDLEPTMGQRDILVETRSGLLKRISELHPSYLPLQYPLLFPYGEDGYREDIQRCKDSNNKSNSRVRITAREFFSFRMHERPGELSTLLFSKRLFQQFLVDAYTMVETGRLIYIRNNQKSLRCEAYKGLSDALTRGEIDPSTQGKRIILPSSFTGGAKYMVQNYQDAMAICRWIGYPNLFITFTCNPKWPEIERYLGKRDLKAEDRPDIVCRIFKMKLDDLIKDLRTGELFGTVRAVIYTIEFQKRGLPHAHILLFLANNDRNAGCNFIDKMIAAEIPDKEVDQEYYKCVEEFMVHGPCGNVRKQSPCMVNGRCSKHFPKKFVDSSTFDKDGYPIYRRRDDGNDRVTAEFYKSTSDSNRNEVIDEINMYYDCRYISACEATWRLFSFEVQFRTPAVERLSFHLPDCQTIIFEDDDPVDNVLMRETIGQSMFNGWFEANKRFPEAKLLTYIEMPTKFVWKKDIREWSPRKKGFVIGRIFYVPPGTGELYYLRCLLNIVRGPTSFEEIRFFNGIQYTSFRDACYARGLLDDDKEYIDAIKEASDWSSAHSMRKLFVTLLTSNSFNRPEIVWKEVLDYLSEDVQYNQRIFLSIPELSYDRVVLADESDRFVSQLTEEQRGVYDTIIGDVSSNKGEIVINVASSGIASLLLPGGRTAHSRFAILININEDSTCNIKPDSDLAELISKAKLIIWDEAPMMHKHYFEALDRTMRDLLRFTNPASERYTFGGKTVVLGGDFRQILPVIPKGSRQDIVSSTINSSYLWESCTILRLTKNLRLENMENAEEKQQVEQFSKWIASIGDGTAGASNEDCPEVVIPNEMLLSSNGDPIATIVESTFPMFQNGSCDNSFLESRAILAPTLDVVNAINDYMSSMHEAESRTYLSCDSVCKTDNGSGVLADVHTPEFLNGLKASGIPNHSLTLKVGSPVMLLRNIDHSLGLCNGTKLVVTRLSEHVIEAKIMSGSHSGTRVLVPRLSMTPSDPRLPFKFSRRQFPLMLSYAMTINKSQGQTLSHMGLLLKKLVFVHGQFGEDLLAVRQRGGAPSGAAYSDGGPPSERLAATAADERRRRSGVLQRLQAVDGGGRASRRWAVDGSGGVRRRWSCATAVEVSDNSGGLRGGVEILGKYGLKLGVYGFIKNPITSVIYSNRRCRFENIIWRDTTSAKLLADVVSRPGADLICDTTSANLLANVVSRWD